MWSNCSCFLGYDISTGEAILGGTLENELPILVLVVPQTLR